MEWLHLLALVSVDGEALHSCHNCSIVRHTRRVFEVDCRHTYQATCHLIDIHGMLFSLQKLGDPSSVMVQARDVPTTCLPVLETHKMNPPFANRAAPLISQKTAEHVFHYIPPH